MGKQLTKKMAELWKVGNTKAFGDEYLSGTRGATREQFKADREIVGTRAWAICQIMRMRDPRLEYSDSECDAILDALK